MKAFLARNLMEASELSQTVTEIREFVAEPFWLAVTRAESPIWNEMICRGMSALISEYMYIQ